VNPTSAITADATTADAINVDATTADDTILIVPLVGAVGVSPLGALIALGAFVDRGDFFDRPLPLPTEGSVLGDPEATNLELYSACNNNC
jgi:hypothetical protein